MNRNPRLVETPVTSPNVATDRNSWRDAVWASDLKPLERLTALAYGDHCRPGESTAWVSLPRLMERTGMCRAAANRAVKGLAEVGWLTLVRRGSQHRSNVYALTVPASQQSAPQTAGDGRNTEQQFTSQTANEPSGLFGAPQRSVRETPLPTRTPSSTTPGSSGHQSPLIFSVEGGGGGREADSKPADTATQAIVAHVETRDPAAARKLWFARNTWQPAAVACLQQGWAPDQLAADVAAESFTGSNNTAAVLRARLQQRAESPPPSHRRPASSQPDRQCGEHPFQTSFRPDGRCGACAADQLAVSVTA